MRMPEARCAESNHSSSSSRQCQISWLVHTSCTGIRIRLTFVLYNTSLTSTCSFCLRIRLYRFLIIITSPASPKSFGRAASPSLTAENGLARCVCYYLCNAHCRRVQSSRSIVFWWHCGFIRTSGFVDDYVRTEWPKIDDAKRVRDSPGGSS